jgi:hypothetical protein
MINESFREWFVIHTEFLYTIIYQKGFLVFDLWSVAHFWSGMVVYMLLTALNSKKRWFWLVFFIVLYEVVEVAFVFFALHIFKPERYNDLILDILVGILAAVLCNYLLLYRSDREKTTRLPAWALMLFSSGTFAFIWVGNYRYTYNYDIFNTKGLNMGAFGLWMIGGFIFLLFYDAISSKESRILRRIILAWIVYFVLLLATEYTGYYLMAWKEVSIPGAKSLVFGLIHGNRALHFYYLIFPFLIIPFYEILSKQVFRAQVNLAMQKHKINEQEVLA